MEENKDAHASLMTIAKKETSLEPINFIELSEILGGGSDKNTTTEEEHKKDPPTGKAGGLVCWCS